MAGEADTQAQAQATAGAEQVDRDALRAELLKEIKPEFDAEIQTWKKRYGDESNVWGTKEKDLQRQLAEAKAIADAAKLSEEATDWIARKRNADQRAADAAETMTRAQDMLTEVKAEKALLAIRKQDWAANVPESWFTKAKERILSGEFITSAELLIEAQALGKPKGGGSTSTGGALGGVQTRTPAGVGERPTLDPRGKNFRQLKDWAAKQAEQVRS